MLAVTYGWTKHDVDRLSYAQIQFFLNKITEDRRREADYSRRMKNRTPRLR